MENVNCLRCRFRHEDNGNCTAVGGFCTAVPAAHCQLLREYLDTGLTPEKIERSKLEIEAGCVKAIARTYGIDINRLRKLAEVDKVLASKEVEYIDRKVLKNDIATSTEPFNTGSVFRAINRQAAADDAPVVHGRWEMRPTGMATDTGPEYKAYCTVCNEPNKQYQPPFCPHCGAKMDGGADNACL